MWYYFWWMSWKRNIFNIEELKLSDKKPIGSRRDLGVENYKFKWEKYATSVCVLCGVALTGMAYYAPSKLPSWFSQRKAYAFGIGSIGLSLAAGGYRYLNKDNKDYMEESI